MSTHQTPWNKGRLLGQKPPLKPKEIWVDSHPTAARQEMQQKTYRPVQFEITEASRDALCAWLLTPRSDPAATCSRAEHKTRISRCASTRGS
jgi:hypothetical protein